MPDPRRMALQNVVARNSENLSSALQLLTPGMTQAQAGAYYHELLPQNAPQTYEHAFERRKKLLLETHGDAVVTSAWFAECKGRFVVGLGDASVLETSLRLLRPWGVPYLPGSALKGVAAKAAHARGGDWAAAPQPGAQPGSHHANLFGSVDQAGLVTFHDAWWKPSKEVPIHPDVMTGHHQDYNGGKGLPLDSDSPNPVSFVSATGTYLVALTGPSDWVELAKALLAEALELDGIGAKTSTGYGRFALGAAVLSEREQARQSALDTLKDLEKRHAGPQTAGAVIKELLDHREALGDEGLLARAADLFRHDPAAWKSWMKKDKRTKDERWVGSALARLQEETPAPTSSTANAPAPTAAPSETWIEGEASVTSDKKAQFVELRVGDAVYRAKFKDVEGAKNLPLDRPTRVRAKLKNGKKLRAIELLP